MLTNPQKAILKRAQRECGMSDDEYRDTLELICCCRSSTSLAMTNKHLDKLLAYFEAVWSRGVAAGTLRPSGSANAVFKTPGYWAAKNTRLETSRDRFTKSNLGQTVADLEGQLAAIGCGWGYCAAIRQNVTKGRTDDRALHLYRVALERTLKAKANRAARAEDPY